LEASPLAGPVIQCPINFSEGRRPGVIEAITDVIRSTPGAALADYSWDFDHNRMVATVLGGPEAIEVAVIAAARAAVREIDLRKHLGAHPRIGAFDVVPIVPIRDITMDECIEVSRRIGRRLGEDLGLPVYLYENSASPGRRTGLPQIRKGGFEGLAAAALEGNLAPDFGPRAVHPTAGACVVGARGPLVAFNVNLDTDRVSAAKRIAARIRNSRDTCPQIYGVRALGLSLPSRGYAQVSMNLTLPDFTPLPLVYRFVRDAVMREGAGVQESEVIGLIPRASLGGETPEAIQCTGFKQTQLLEYWLE
jgi:glutamate formiminotransferase